MLLETLAIVSALATMYGADQSKKSAREQAQAQKKEMRRQQRIKDAQAYRAGRIREAQLLAQGAGQYGGSLTAGAVAGNRYSLENQVTLGNDIVERQIGEINIGLKNFTQKTGIQTGMQVASIATNLVMNQPSKKEPDFNFTYIELPGIND